MAQSGQIAFDNPEAYIARDRRCALAAGREMPDRVRGAALLADISGFTPLTEALASELGPQRGAEEVTASLDRVFGRVVDELDRYGGDVIYFSGDAITCWLDGDDGSRATACGLAMQSAMAAAGEIVTPAGASIRLAMKVAVAVGPARRFVVGDPRIQLLDVLAGSLVDELAAAEQHASMGEVVLEQSALESLGHRIELARQRRDDASGRAIGVVTRLLRPVAGSAVAESEAPLSDDLVRPWILPPVYERLRSGRGEFLAELRPAIPVFVRFGGIDYDRDDAAVAKLDDFVRRAQRIFCDYGGNLLQLTLGDKGNYLYAVFGSPLAHEDDAARAAAAALELRTLDGATAASGIGVGIAHGRLRSGTYGHAMRRTFGCLGDAVNVAARLMSSSPPGQVYVAAAVQQQAGESFIWERLPDLPVKGKAEPVAAYALAGAARPWSRRETGQRLELVGRRAELAALAAALADAVAGRGAVVGIAAAAGVGKSRLVAEFVRSVPVTGLLAFGECQSLGTSASYFVWQEIWRSLLRVDDREPVEVQRAALERELAAIDPGLVPRAPLLGAVLGIEIPDSDLTATFDAKLRKASLEDLLAECLRARSAQQLVVLALEDCHWIDPLSRDLLEVLARAAAGLPVLIVLAYRPEGEPGLEQIPCFGRIDLPELQQHDAELLVRAKVAQLFGAGTPAPPALVDLVTARSEGNPFYLEQLLNYIRGQGVDPQDGAALRRLQLPESLHSLVLSRVDTLADDPRRTLKVASVVGRSFSAAALPAIYPELGSPEEVRGHLQTLVSLDLVAPDPDDHEGYLFKHGVTQEVTYEGLPFAIRADLHERVGGYLEQTGPEAIELQLDLLAHHYWHSENLPKKRDYLVRAAKVAQANYANAAAIDYFERAAPLVAEREQVDVLLELGKVLELVGDWARAEEVEGRALAGARRLGDERARAWCEVALAEVARKQGRYDDATALLATSAAAFEAAGEEAGVGRVLHLAGTLAAQQGQYDAAEERYRESLRIRERLGDRVSMAAVLSNLGVVAEYRGDYDGSWAYHERALALRIEVGDRQAIGVSKTNLGTIAVLRHDNEEAREQFSDAMRLNREVGDAWMVAINHNNLGNATRGLRDYDAARAHYADSLRAYRDYDDRWALAFLLEDIGQLAALTGEAELAFELVGAADRLRDEIGTPRAPALADELEAQLARVHETLDLPAREAARGRGRGLDPGDAIDLALCFCRGKATVATGNRRWATLPGRPD